MSTPWRTSTVVELCRQMRADHDYSFLPILADALEDASYGDEDVLRQCRDPKTDATTAERLVARLYSDETAAAVAWLDRFVQEINDDDWEHTDPDGERRHDPWMTYPKLVDGLREYLRTARDDDEYAGANMYLPFVTPDVIRKNAAEMWGNFAAVTGAAVSDPKAIPFRCGC